MTRRRAVLLALAAALFWLCRRAYWVGFFNDDAYYLIAARSLLTGRFAELQTPGAPPLVHYLPGWPLLLAPAVVLSRGSLAFLQAFAVAVHVAALGLLASVFEREDGKDAADLALAAAALSPLIASTAATLLADGPMLFAAASALAFLPFVWRRRDAGAWLAFGLALGLAALVRPTGLALAAAVALAAAWDGRRREAACALGAASAVFAAWLWRDAAVSGASWNYWRQASALRASTGLPLAANAAFYARELFARAIWRWPVPSRAVGAALALGGTALAGLGLTSLRTPSGRAAALFAVLYAAPHLAWGLQASRYMIPVLPFAFWAAWRGLAAFSRRGAFAAAAASILLSSFATARVVRASLSPSDRRSLQPARTAAWLQAHAGPGDLLGSRYDARWHLLTGLAAAQLPPRAPATLFVVDAEPEIGGVGVREDRRDAEERALLDSGASLAFADGTEGTEVWRLRRSSR